MESTKNQNNVTNESNTGLGLDAAHHRVEADASPYAGEDEEMVENSVGVSDDENSVDGNYKTIERSTGGDLIASWAGTVEGTPVDTEPESDEAAKTLRFNALCQRAMKFAEDAATSPGTYEVALRVLEKAVEVVESAKKGVAVAEEDISMNEIVLHKFQQAKTRGRDPNPSGEKPQKRSRKCIICKGSAHDKRNCPTLKGSSATDNSEGNPDKKRQGSLEGTSESSDNNTALALGNEPDSGGKELVSGPGPKKVLGKVGRTSTYHGVTRHRWTGRFEAHLWDNNWVKEGQKRKGKLVYLGGYDEEEKAAKAYDLAALKYWGLSPTLKLNFPASDYEKELESVTHMGREEFINYMRRKSSGFSRGASIYRGVTRRQHDGKWQARIGRTPGNKDEFYYLGTYDTEREAAEAYDVAALEIRGLNAVTNFDISNYCQGGWKELEQFCKIKKIAQDWVNRAETIKQLTLGSEGGLNKPT